VQDDEYVVRPSGRPLNLLPEDPDRRNRLVQFNILVPYHLSAKFRQVCHEKNLTASGVVRQQMAQWIREQEQQQT
jgi:hypothetical protein